MSASLLPATPAALQDLYSRLSQAVQEAPHEGSLPLFIAGRRCGLATPNAVNALVSLPGVSLAEGGLSIGRDYFPGAELDALLADVALLLHEAGCLRGWRDELLDIFPEDNSPCVGVIERAAMRPLGLLTRAVHLNAWTQDGRLWIARRSLTKSTDPGMWDTLVGGLVGTGEDLDLALVRECDEEAGLDAPHITQRTPLRTLLRMYRRLPEGLQNEDVLTSTCVLASDVKPANRDGEVMEIRQATMAEALRMVEEEAFTQEASLVIVEDMLFRFSRAAA